MHMKIVYFVVKRIVEKYCNNSVKLLLTFANFYSNNNIYDKYCCLDRHILSNEYLNPGEREKCLLIFSLHQRLHMAFNRLKYAYKLKKQKK